MAITSTCEPSSRDRFVAKRTPLKLRSSTDANSIISGSCAEETCTRDRQCVDVCDLRVTSDPVAGALGGIGIEWEPGSYQVAAIESQSGKDLNNSPGRIPSSSTTLA